MLPDPAIKSVFLGIFLFSVEKRHGFFNFQLCRIEAGEGQFGIVSAFGILHIAEIKEPLGFPVLLQQLQAHPSGWRACCRLRFPWP